MLESGASHAQIQAVCRWQTEDSLRIYARLNASKYKQLLDGACAADVQSVTAATLPTLSDEVTMRLLLGLTLADAVAAGNEAQRAQDGGEADLDEAAP